MGDNNFTIRLLDDPPMPGPRNMAVDWWLLNHSDQPTLRFYDWTEPTLTVGYRQQFDPPDELPGLMKQWSSAVRPTGGGYLLHTGELTYSFSVPSQHPMAELSIMEFYRVIRDSFVNSLQDAGYCLDVKTGKKSESSADCLKGPSDHEPTMNGDKWMASAQVRHDGNVLQHGSLYLDETEWPSEWPGARPGFLGVGTSGELKEMLIDGFLGNYGTDIGLERTSGLTEDENGVESLVPRFRVDGVSDLPCFQRTVSAGNP